MSRGGRGGGFGRGGAARVSLKFVCHVDYFLQAGVVIEEASSNEIWDLLIKF